QDPLGAGELADLDLRAGQRQLQDRIVVVVLERLAERARGLDQLGLSLEALGLQHPARAQARIEAHGRRRGGFDLAEIRACESDLSLLQPLGGLALAKGGHQAPSYTGRAHRRVGCADFDTRATTEIRQYAD